MELIFAYMVGKWLTPPCLLFSSGSHQSFITNTIETFFLSIYIECQALCEKKHMVSNIMSFILVWLGSYSLKYCILVIRLFFCFSFCVSKISVGGCCYSSFIPNIIQQPAVFSVWKVVNKHYWVNSINCTLTQHSGIHRTLKCSSAHLKVSA